MQSLEYSKNSEQKLPSFLKIALSYSDVIKGSFKLKKKKEKKAKGNCYTFTKSYFKNLNSLFLLSIFFCFE